jgi:hypothetical protein
VIVRIPDAVCPVKGGWKMDLGLSLFWGSPIGLGVFFLGLGVLFIGIAMNRK